MHTTHLRKVGGSILLAVPPAFLDPLRRQAGTMVGLAIEHGCLVVHLNPRRRHTTLSKLPAEAEAVGGDPLPLEERAWVNAPVVRRERL